MVPSYKALDVSTKPRIPEEIKKVKKDHGFGLEGAKAGQRCYEKRDGKGVALIGGEEYQEKGGQIPQNRGQINNTKNVSKGPTGWGQCAHL